MGQQQALMAAKPLLRRMWSWGLQSADFALYNSLVYGIVACKPLALYKHTFAVLQG